MQFSDIMCNHQQNTLRFYIRFSTVSESSKAYILFQPVQFFPELFQMFYGDFILVNNPQAIHFFAGLYEGCKFL